MSKKFTVILGRSEIITDKHKRSFLGCAEILTGNHFLRFNGWVTATQSSEANTYPTEQFLRGVAYAVTQLIEPKDGEGK